MKKIELMSKDWEKYKVSELVNQGILEKPLDGNHGELHPTMDDYVEKGIPFVMATDISDGNLDLEHCSFISFERSKSLRKGFAKEGDVLLTHKATIGRTAIVPKIDTDYIVLTPQVTYYRVRDTNKLNNYFLKYYFCSTFFQGNIAQYASAGATRAYIGITDQLELEIILPPIEAQRRIAEILGRYDALIENYQRQIGILEASAQALYREWFVRGRCPYARYEDDAKLPVGWESAKVGDVLELKYGKSLIEESRTGGDYPVVGSSGIVDYHNEFLVDRGGIVVGRKGNVGSVFWIDKPFFPIDTAFYVESKLSLYYLFFNLKSQNFISGDAAVPGLNREQALSNEMIKPADEVLAQFDKLIEPLFSKIGNLQSQIALLRQMRDKLLPRLMSGQIPLTATG